MGFIEYELHYYDPREFAAFYSLIWDYLLYGFSVDVMTLPHAFYSLIWDFKVDGKIVKIKGRTKLFLFPYMGLTGNYTTGT